MTTNREAEGADRGHERALFEDYFSDQGTWPKSVDRESSGEYRLASAYAAWKVWQACLAARTTPASAAQADEFAITDDPITDAEQAALYAFTKGDAKIHSIVRKLYCAASAQAVQQPEPAGWKLVPIEPTEAMCFAGFMTSAGTPELCWRDMIAAAPQPDQGAAP